MILQTLAALLAALGFAILFAVPRRRLVVTGLAGALGWGVYLLCLELGLSVTLATFVGALGIGLLCEGWALIKREDPMVLEKPAIIPLVPGTVVYQAHLASFAGRFGEAGTLAVQTVLYGGAIALGLGLARLIWRTLHPAVR